MFESIIERKSKELFDLLVNNQPYIYLTEILQNPKINENYLEYFKAEVNCWIYEEQLSRKENPNFDLTNKSLKEFFKELDALYFELARFDIPHLKIVTEQCASVIANYIVRPRTTLKWFVFRGEPTKTIKEIILRINYFSDYSYIKNGFFEWLKSNNIEYNADAILSISEFKRIIEDTDNQKLYNITIDEFILLIEPIFHFFYDGESNNDTIPIEALILFLDDKCLYPISEKLAKDSTLKNYNKIDRTFIKEYMSNLLIEFENSYQQNQTNETDGEKA